MKSSLYTPWKDVWQTGGTAQLIPKLDIRQSSSDRRHATNAATTAGEIAQKNWMVNRVGPYRQGNKYSSEIQSTVPTRLPLPK